MLRANKLCQSAQFIMFNDLALSVVVLDVTLLSVFTLNVMAPTVNRNKQKFQTLLSSGFDEAKVCSRSQCYKTFYDRKLHIFVISYRFCPGQAFPAKSNVCG